PLRPHDVRHRLPVRPGAVALLPRRRRLAARQAGAGGADAGALHRRRALAEGPGQGPRTAVGEGAALVQRTAGAAAARDRLAGAGEAVLTGRGSTRTRADKAGLNWTRFIRFYPR